jgi:hypothetical protein
MQNKVVSLWPDSRAGLEEIIDHRAIDYVPVGDVAVVEIPVEQAQRLRIINVLAVQRALVLHELMEKRRQEALEKWSVHRASPSPMATSRRTSIATFV